MSRNAAFDDFVSRLGRLAGLPAETAKEAAPLVEEALKRFAAAGLDPSGKAWKEKKDGGRALVHAADAITVTPKGTALIVELEGPEVFHNSARKGKATRRQVVPGRGEIPPHVAAAIQEGAARAFEKIMGGR